ncbi:hypothetical protein [Prevotella sp. oral taxon 376]|nr:hypothetical protein [Prevotella sp. oral taxon 376]
MSERSKIRRAQREARQEKQARKVIMWIGGLLVVFALCLLVYAMAFM